MDIHVDDQTIRILFDVDVYYPLGMEGYFMKAN